MYKRYATETCTYIRWLWNGIYFCKVDFRSVSHLVRLVYLRRKMDKTYLSYTSHISNRLDSRDEKQFHN